MVQRSIYHSQPNKTIVDYPKKAYVPALGDRVIVLKAVGDVTDATRYIDCTGVIDSMWDNGKADIITIDKKDIALFLENFKVELYDDN